MTLPEDTVNYAVAAFALCLMILFSGCVTRGEIEAAIWMNNGMSKKLCGPSKAESPNPELWKYGFFRVLNDDVCRDHGLPKGCKEFMPFCNPESRKFFGMHEKDFNRLLDATLPRDDE